MTFFLALSPFLVLFLPLRGRLAVELWNGTMAEKACGSIFRVHLVHFPSVNTVSYPIMFVLRVSALKKCLESRTGSVFGSCFCHFLCVTPSPAKPSSCAVCAPFFSLQHRHGSRESVRATVFRVHLAHFPSLRELWLPSVSPPQEYRECFMALVLAFLPLLVLFLPLRGRLARQFARRSFFFTTARHKRKRAGQFSVFTSCTSLLQTPCLAR